MGTLTGSSLFVRYNAPAHGADFIDGVYIRGPQLSFDVGPLFDCTPFTDPSKFAASSRDSIPTVLVGATVQWTYAPWLSPVCESQIVSTSVPAGGKSFDSGIIYPGQTFQFIPGVTGTWTFIDKRNGGSGSFTANAR